MIVAADYRDGRIREFDLSLFTSPNAMTAFDRGSVNIATAVDLRLDRLDEEGLRLDYFWYDVAKSRQQKTLDGVEDQDGEAVSVYVAPRRAAFSVTLLEPFELVDVVRVTVHRAGQPIQAAWRQGSGNWLINGVAFDAARIIAYSDSGIVSMNKQAYSVHSYLMKANPELTTEEAATEMGYPPEAFAELMEDEMRQSEDGESDEGGWGAKDAGVSDEETHEDDGEAWDGWGIGGYDELSKEVEE